VRFVGRISDASLAGLYGRALGLLFLSRYEGFGLPLIEAMGCGCPVIASNVCSLPEVAGDAAPLFDPDDVPGIARAMDALAGEPGHRDELVARSRRRAEQFTWERAAAETVKVYQSLLSSS
jgi:alpha-1,3-rhamnosyl/mannosyltransferase